jgi:hypothetical protein
MYIYTYIYIHIYIYTYTYIYIPNGWKAIDIIEYSNLNTFAHTPRFISQTLTSYPIYDDDVMMFSK